MKIPIIAFLILVLAGEGVSAQTSSSCIPSGLLSSTYDKDVKDIAMQRIYAFHSPDTSLIDIPQRYCDTIIEGLAAICNLDTLLQADSVFNSYCIHLVPHGLTRYSFMVQVDTSYVWAKQWALLHTVTGYTPLDNFMSLHGFTVTSYICDSSYPADLNNWATITTAQALNWRAFADSLRLFPGVVYIDTSGGIGDGNRILYQKDSVQTYTFILGFGDCPSGCTSTKVWVYKVDSLCNVTLLLVTESGPDAYPIPPNCDLFKVSIPVINKELFVKTYPNPVDDMLHISITGYSQSCNYTLTDMYGRTVNQGAFVSNADVNTSILATGVYLLQVRNSDGQLYYAKVVKN